MTPTKQEQRLRGCGPEPFEKLGTEIPQFRARKSLMIKRYQSTGKKKDKIINKLRNLQDTYIVEHLRNTQKKLPKPYAVPQEYQQAC